MIDGGVTGGLRAPSQGPPCCSLVYENGTIQSVNVAAENGTIKTVKITALRNDVPARNFVDKARSTRSQQRSSRQGEGWMARKCLLAGTGVNFICRNGILPEATRARCMTRVAGDKLFICLTANRL